jgi:hypothetical protein
VGEFLFKIALFFLLVISLLVLSLFLVPDITNENNLLAAIPAKHILVKKNNQPRIIFIGGSNVSFGLNSKEISDTFKRPVVNMAVHGGLGLKYNCDELKPFVNKGDVIILVPEYENFYTDNFYGEMELVSVLFDIDPQAQKDVSFIQWMHLLKYVPTYSAKKIKNYFISLFSKKNIHLLPGIYSKESFNSYGDAYIHWALPNTNFDPAIKNTKNDRIHLEVISFIKKYKIFLEEKGVSLILLPPIIEEISYNNMQNMIEKIAIELKKNNISFICNPLRYKFPNSYFFNSYYHLNKKGVDKRTQMIIEDLESVLKNK